MNRHNIVRYEVTRTLVFQGPEDWVRGTLQRMIMDTIQVGPDKFIIGTAPQIKEVEVDLAIEPDRSMASQEEHRVWLTAQERKIKA